MRLLLSNSVFVASTFKPKKELTFMSVFCQRFGILLAHGFHSKLLFSIYDFIICVWELDMHSSRFTTTLMNQAPVTDL